MLNGKYIFIDIGSSETKIVEAVVKPKGITLLKTAEMRDMSAFIDDTGLIHDIEFFCLSLGLTLKKAGIKTTDAVVCSSIFGIKVQDITEAFNSSVKDCTANFDKKFGRTTNYSVVSDWQHLGDQFQEKNIIQKLTMASGGVTLLTSFVETMKSVAGINVVSIEPSAVTLCNLNTLFPHNFDMPSLAVVDLGSENIHFKIFKENAFVAAVDLKYSKGNVYEALAEKFNTALPKMTNIAYNIGINDTEQNAASLSAATISRTQYFSFMREYINGVLEDINEQINYLKNAKKLDDVQVVFTGGLMALPGLAEYVEENFKDHPRRVLIIDTLFKAKKFKIVNKTNHKLLPKFNTCLGMTLRNYNVHSVNLLPTEFTLVDSAKVVSKIIRTAQITLAAIIVLIAVCSIGNITGCVNLASVNEKLKVAEVEVNALKDNDATMGAYIKNLTSIDNSLAPLTRFLSSCESKDLKIASVDTASILSVVIVDEEQNSDAVNNIFNGLIVRGYATSSNEITKFYESLKNYKYISSVGMNGIKEVSLSDTDTIYIFEMEVSVSDQI